LWLFSLEFEWTDSHEGACVGHFLWGKGIMPSFSTNTLSECKKFVPPYKPTEPKYLPRQSSFSAFSRIINYPTPSPNPLERITDQSRTDPRFNDQTDRNFVLQKTTTPILFFSHNQSPV
jgi:hypothetical protein